jgi:hypothetical protein
MTIDERLERLTERHEALTQSMELFQHDIAEMRAAAAERDAKYDERFSRILDVVENLRHGPAPRASHRTSLRSDCRLIC